MEMMTGTLVLSPPHCVMVVDQTFYFLSCKNIDAWKWRKSCCSSCQHKHIFSKYEDMLWFNPGSQLDPQDYRSLPSAWMQSLIYVLVACNVGKGNFPYYLSSCLQAAYYFYNHFGKILNLNVQSTFLPLSAICTFSYFTANFDLSSLPSFLQFPFSYWKLSNPFSPCATISLLFFVFQSLLSNEGEWNNFENQRLCLAAGACSCKYSACKNANQWEVWGKKSNDNDLLCNTVVKTETMYFAEYKWSENDGIENTGS